ncbi:MAG: hypothetical protein KDH20_08135 [Rhodocyclaceae bacterium]|nr:hypothetical protein [Rhodocyclaceae bacterium]
MQTHIRFTVAVAALLGGAACSSQQLYATGQSYQRQQCHRLADEADRNSCLSDADRSYEDYKRELPEGAAR